MIKTINLPERTSSTQTHTITLPSLVAIKKITSNRGAVTVKSIDGDKVTVEVKGASYTRSVQTGGSYTPSDSKFVRNQPSSNYNSGGYSGTLSSYVASGSYTPADSKTVTTTKSANYEEFLNYFDLLQTQEAALQKVGLTSSLSYDSGGYKGTLNRVSVNAPGDSIVGNYSGTVTKPASDTRYYRYEGTVTKPASDTRTYDYYYQYDITVEYEDNTLPTLTLSTLDKKTLYEKEQLPITGDVTDTDAGNVVTVKYQINSTTVRNVKAYVSNGVKETFDKPLTFRGGNLYDGSTLVASNLAEGVNHTLKVWAEDDQGGKSEIATRTFKVITNRPPVLAITSTPTANNLLDEDTITIEGTATDPDGNSMTLTAQIHDATKTIPIDNNGQWSFSFALNLLKDGDNIITFTLADQYQVTDTASVKVTRNAQCTYTPNVAMRFAVSSPEDIDTLIMWIKRGAADTKLRAMISVDKPGDEQNFVVMEKRETISNIAGSTVHEDEFFFTGQKEGQATIKMTNVEGIRIMMGATSNESKTT